MSTESECQLELAQARALLTMSRELLQADQRPDILERVGQTIVELTGAHSALLLVRAGSELVVGFDRGGRVSRAGPDHPWYREACRMLDAPDQRGVRQAGPVAFFQGLRTLVLGIPAPGAVAALVAGWEDGSGDEAWTTRRRILSTMLELTVAALGKLQTRTSLEALVVAQYEQISDTAQVHAAELARRDDAEQAMRMLSQTDVLTGLNNRRGFFSHAEQMFMGAQRRHARSAVIFADVDGLKLVNDRLGHETGDMLIRDTASVFRESFRNADVVARLGGDEFVAYTIDDARPEVILARLQANLRAFNLMQERPYHISISAGIVQCDPAGGRDLSGYVLQADQKMYLQKQRRLH